MSRTVKPTDYWETPDKVFLPLHAEIGFTLDAAATAANAKCSAYYTELTDGLALPWSGHVVWCNPPYSKGNLKVWTDKAREEAVNHGVISCLLIPHDTSTKWWWSGVIGKGNPTDRLPYPNLRGSYAYQESWGIVQVYPIPHRVVFCKGGKPAKNGPTFPSAAVIYCPFSETP